MKGLVARFATRYCGPHFLWGWLKVELTAEEKLKDAQSTVRSEFMQHRVLSTDHLTYVRELITGTKDPEVYWTNHKRTTLDLVPEKEAPFLAAYTMLAPYTPENEYPEQTLYTARQSVKAVLSCPTPQLGYQKILAEAIKEHAPRCPIDVARAIASIIFHCARIQSNKESK